MKREISLESSQKIKNMSLLCAFLVASIHVQWAHDQSITAGWVMYHAIKEGVARIAVPFFFIISGFFLAKHFDEEGWWGREVKKRVKSLVVPFLFWSTISFTVTMLLNIIADMIAHRPFGITSYILHSTQLTRLYGLDLTEYPLHVPLWYVRCLFLFVLTGHLFMALVSRFKYIWIACAFAFVLVYNHLPSEDLRQFFHVGYSAAGILYFSIGVAIQRFRLNIVSNRVAIVCVAIGLSLLGVKLLFAYNTWRGEQLIGKIMLPFLIYFIWHFITSKKVPDWLTACSFPIFLMHAVFFGCFGIVCVWGGGGGGVDGLLRDFIIYLCGVLGSIIIALSLRRFVPKVAAMLFGGR